MGQEYVARTLCGKKHDRLQRITRTKPDRQEPAGLAEKKRAEFAECAAAHGKAAMSPLCTGRNKFARDTLDFYLNGVRGGSRR